MSDRLVTQTNTYTNTHTQRTNTHALSGIAARDDRNQTASDLCLRLQGYRDRPWFHSVKANLLWKKFAFINYKSGAVIREITGVAAKFKIMKDVEGRFTSFVSALMFIRKCRVQNLWRWDTWWTRVKKVRFKLAGISIRENSIITTNYSLLYRSYMFRLKTKPS